MLCLRHSGHGQGITDVATVACMQHWCSMLYLVLHSPLLQCAHNADEHFCYCRCRGSAAVGACSGSKSMVLAACRWYCSCVVVLLQVRSAFASWFFVFVAHCCMLPGCCADSGLAPVCKVKFLTVRSLVHLRCSVYTPDVYKSHCVQQAILVHAKCAQTCDALSWQVYDGEV